MDIWSRKTSKDKSFTQPIQYNAFTWNRDLSHCKFSAFCPVIKWQKATKSGNCVHSRCFPNCTFLKAEIKCLHMDSKKWRFLKVMTEQYSNQDIWCCSLLSSFLMLPWLHRWNTLLLNGIFKRKISVFTWKHNFFVRVWGLRYNMQREEGYIFSASNKTDTT